MKTYYPSYYEKFSCIASECTDSCCKAWEIVIDKNTYDKYLNLDCSFGEKIRSHIVSDADGDKCFSLVDGRCPFLNERGLCDIHINLGEEATSEICRVHPRFVEEYDGFTEISLSLSCPEACRLIFNSDINNNLYPTPLYTGDDEVLRLLISSRERLFRFKRDFSFLSLVVLDTAADDSLDIDMVYVNEHPSINIAFLNEFIEVLLSSEILTDEWKMLLEKSFENEISSDLLEKNLIENDGKLCNLCHYLIYRYYLKAVNDLDIYSRALFIVSSCYLCIYISAVCNISFAETARLFSKETEHNLDNINTILEFFSNF